MCYHKNLTTTKKQLEERYDAELPEGTELKPVYHVTGFSYPLWPILTVQQPKQFQMVHWGLIPTWVKSPDQADEIKARTLNARSEEVFGKASFRHAAEKGQRCLIPISGFFEWHTEKGKKYPFYIYPLHQDIVSIAGLYEDWTDTDSGEVIRTYTVLTSEANPLLARIHNSKKRMPVLLTQEDEQKWLQDNLSEKAMLAMCAHQYPETELESHTISKLITNRDGDPTNVPEIVKPFEYPELKFD